MVIDYKGKGQDGYGYLKVHKPLSSSYNVENIDYEADNSLGGNVQGRSYFLNSNTVWTGTTYILEYEVEVSYERVGEITKPDLIADDITSTDSIEVGKAATFTATYRNVGTNIGNPFNVKIMDETGTVIKLNTIPSAASGASSSLSFSYTFTTAAAKTFKLSVDSSGAINEENEGNNEVTRTFTPGAVPAASDFTGDFDIVPSTIEYGQSFTLHPKDFNLNGCTYQYHIYKFERGGVENQTQAYSSISDTSFSRSDYPTVVGVGSHNVYLKIATSCGTTDWIGPKQLEVNGPSNNHPPQFQIAFVKRSEPTKPVHQIIEGEVLDLVVVNDPAVPTPFDPDGDTMSFDGFLFDKSDPWMQSLPGKYPQSGWGMYGIVMEKGFHNISGQIRDQWGATAQAVTYINVISKSPVPVIKCPASVIANHIVPDSAFDSSGSYSPVSGRTIDHSRDEWTNKQLTYANDTDQDLTVQIFLDVYDNQGRKSDSPASCNLVVKPDQPPLAKLNVPSVGIRNEPNVILNQSYSPDGDTIVNAEYKYKYDAANNGFYDDAWQDIKGSLKSVTFSANKVGKYLFYVKVTEDYGKSGDTANQADSTLTFNIVNNAPEVSFEVEGKNPQPDLEASTTIRPDTMLNWPLYVPNSSEQVFSKNNLWRIEGGSLVSGDARNFGNQANYMNNYPVFGGGKAWNFAYQQPNGFGTNNLSPWRSLSSVQLNDYIINDNGDPVKIIPSSHRLAYGNNVYTDDADQFKMRSNQKLLYFDDSAATGMVYEDTVIYALDPKKLSPLDGISGGWTMKYKYRNGDPYAFRINLKNKNNYFNNWEVAGKYLYVSSLNSSGYRLAVYDAFSGQLLNQTTKPFDLGFSGTDPVSSGYEYWQIVYAKGSSVVLRTVKSNAKPGEVYAQFAELSPDLSLRKLADWRVPQPRADFGARPYAAAKPLFTDPYGNVYTYEGFTIRNGENTQYLDLSINKYDANLNPIWKRYLTAPNDFTTVSPGGAPGLNGIYSYDNFSPLEINTFAGEISVQVYEMGYDGFISYPSIYTLNMWDGTIKAYHNARGGSGTGMFDFASHYTNWNGSLSPGKGSVTVDGSRTEFNMRYPGNYGNTAPCNDGIAVYGPNGATSNTIKACYVRYGQYYGDGVYVYLTGGSSSSDDANLLLNVAVGTPNGSSLVRQSFTSGQFLSDVSLSDAEMKYSFRMEDIDYDNEWNGFSFRMQDTSNRYAVETDGHSFNLVKYVDGNKTVLKSGSYAFQSNASYAVKVKAAGSQIDVFLNNIPILTANDGSYSQGRFGYFSNKAFVRFSAFTYKPVKQGTVEWSDSYAIWDEGTARAEVAYNNIQFLDPEGDPKAGSYKWSVEHTPRFLNNQGMSGLNGITFDSEQLIFDKVGDYVVTLQAKDDPNPSYLYPDNTFNEYRKYSNAFSKRVTVHRRPIALFTVTPAGDGKVIWTDSSFDPDRYESTTSYSTENTGIDYRTTRGVLEKKFYYITPSGNTVYEKLVTPQEKGMYEIGMAVKDEYGAWSTYAVQSLDVSTIPTPNSPPVPGFTTSSVNTFRGLGITIDSTARDNEDGGRDNLPHQYFIRNVTTNGAESFASTSRTSWMKTFSSLGTFNIRQIVHDSAGAEAQFSRQVNIYNQVPGTQVTVPASADANNPTKLTEIRPQFQWNYFDADGDPQTRYQLKIYQYGGTVVLDTDIKPGNALSMRPSVDLPEHVNMYVQIRVFDGYDWSGWSSPKFFYIETNRPPNAAFDWSPKPVWEGDDLTLIDQSTDPDGDLVTGQWTVTDPMGMMTVYDTPPVIARALQGTYRIRLTVSDGKAQSEAERAVQVQPLTLGASVEHTAEWLKIHEQAGHETAGDPKDFYAGEVMIVHGYTSAAPVSRVTVKLSAAGLSGDQLDTEAVLAFTGEANHYAGRLYDSRWSSLTDGLDKGLYTLRFEVLYRNGTVKTANVPFRIIGSVYKAGGVHRRQ
ncbi:hypothetical protein VN24_02180 [Paenibacillus beijingensis]|uniref:CARDB domain-containing protein n=2 Tax=Paenibacillus beijingensis TaxID=1126833 RepID=A0A0D5NFC1_9BACL|nr:CARDB domain-containing protein [Paenibacillus beijingensis]AJY73652.1 hypothetical protein VN24_02180 [Paenibacillus beijingensis]